MTKTMDDNDLDHHLARGRYGGPAVQFVRGEEDSLLLWYGTFDVILRALHDLWWRDRKVGRLRLVADWIGDRGLFDPDAGSSVLDDPEATVVALGLARDRLARTGIGEGDEADEALAALIRFVAEAVEGDLRVRVERAGVGTTEA
ncbi:hypothetical protein [Tautonia plasticadhaerens]|uniref:Uncharacterized protein n=1 Tax=Tautonia plasticadhaerens TaxID=2527974 RepID=A0A518GWE3_9BACT|nr:hypothetical protein [Tautonia plasticadhaerens]QDV32904.1 hypothetical protein ElP_07440 [Tautonia plasticadhaerens]